VNSEREAEGSNVVRTVNCNREIETILYTDSVFPHELRFSLHSSIDNGELVNCEFEY